MRILVSGGTGFIGSHIVRELVTHTPDVSVRVLTRRSSATLPPRERTEYVQGDVTLPASLPPALNGVEGVIHCVQFPNHPVENPAKGWTYKEIDARGTKNLVTASTQAGIRRFVYLSGAGTAPGKPQSWFQAKWEAEESVRNSGIEYVILRPSWIYGPEDRSLNRFVKITRCSPLVPVIGSGRGKVQPISVFDVAKVAAQAATRADAANRVFELGGPQELSLNEILRALQRILDKRRLLVHFPVPLMKFIARFLSLFPNPPISPSAIEFILMEARVDARPAETFFGMQFEGLETGLRRYLAPG